MDKRKSIYYLINVAVILVTINIFIIEYASIFASLIQKGIFYIITTVIAVIFANLCKMLRLYVIIYGEKYKFWDYIKNYFKTNMINILVPFKLGDLFKMYCIGNLLRNTPKGIVSVLLDRFVDTAALISLVLLVALIGKGRISTIIVLLIVFLIIAFLFFSTFPAFYSFWNRYILRLDSNKHRLSVLKVLDILKHMYNEVISVSKGRSLILYLLSILAWVIELGRILIYAEYSKTMLSIDIERAGDYLLSAIGGIVLSEYSEFAYVNLVLSFLTYLLVKVVRNRR